MPIEIQYTEDKIGVVFCAVGRVTGEEIIAAQKSGLKTNWANPCHD